MKVEYSLKSRTKGQRLSIEEKKEIFNQISKGIPTKDLRELYQISNSTILRIVNHLESYKQTEQVPYFSTSQLIRNRKI